VKAVIFDDVNFNENYSFPLVLQLNRLRSTQKLKFEYKIIQSIFFWNLFFFSINFEKEGQSAIKKLTKHLFKIKENK